MMLDIYEMLLQKLPFGSNDRKKSHFQKVKNLFANEQYQLLYILRKSGGYRQDYPLGVKCHILIDDIASDPSSGYYRNKTYVASMINALTTLGLFELRANSTMQITPLGFDYIMDSDKK